MNLPSPVFYSLDRCLLGLWYILLHSWGKAALGESADRPELLLLQEDEEGLLLFGTVRLWIWTKVHLALYVGVFLVSEGACVLTGAGYNGVDPGSGEVRRIETMNALFCRIHRFE